MTVHPGLLAIKRLAILSKLLAVSARAFASRALWPAYIFFHLIMRFFSSSDDMDINLSKHRTAIGSLKTGFFFSDSTTRQSRAKIAVRDISDRFKINLLFHHEKALERTWWSPTIGLTCIPYIGELFAEERSDDCKKCDNSNDPESTLA
jgi:hypothetical protein